MNSAVYILLIVGFVTGFDIPENKDVGDKTNINDYVDSMLPSVIKYFLENGMDPMELPDIVEHFSVKPVIITYHGELELTNGWFKNLRSLRRSGDVNSVTDGNILKLSGNFALENIRFDYDYLAKIMNIGPKGGVEGSIKTVNIFCEIHKNTDKNQLRLKDFYLYNTGAISVQFTGNALIDWLTNALVHVVATLAKDVILYFVEKAMRNEIQELIDEYNFANVNPNLVRIGDLQVKPILRDDKL